MKRKTLKRHKCFYKSSILLLALGLAIIFITLFCEKPDKDDDIEIEFKGIQIHDNFGIEAGFLDIDDGDWTFDEEWGQRKGSVY